MNNTASEIYLLSLQSESSKVAMTSFLNKWATMLQGVSSHNKLDWLTLSYTSILEAVTTLKNQGKAPSTINNYLAAIKGAAKEAWKKEELTTRQYQYIKDIKRITGSRTNKGVALSKEQLRGLITTCHEENTKRGCRDAAIIALSYGAGLRRSEAANLSLEDYSRKDKTIRILGKGNKEEVSTLNTSTISILEEWISVRGNTKGSLFLRSRRGDNLENKSVTDQAIYDMVVARCKQAGLGKVSPHSLRKSFATQLLENGEDLFIVQDLMRHANIATTKTYDLRGKGVRVTAAQNLIF